MTIRTINPNRKLDLFDGKIMHTFTDWFESDASMGDIETFYGFETRTRMIGCGGHIHNKRISKETFDIVVRPILAEFGWYRDGRLHMFLRNSFCIAEDRDYDEDYFKLSL